MNEFAINPPPTREHWRDAAWFWFVVSIVFPAAIFVIVATDKNAEYRELDKERSKLQLELHNREAIIRTQDETIRELRKR